MAAAAKSDQLVDVLKQIQSRKTVKQEDATKALAQYYKVQDHIKALKVEIDLFKANQAKQVTVTNSRRGSTVTTIRKNSVASINGIKTISPATKPPSRVLNRPTTINSYVTNSDGSTKRSPSRILNGPTTIKSYPTDSEAVPKVSVKKGDQENGVSQAPSYYKDVEKDKEIARLRMQNAQLKVTLENRVTAALVKTVDVETGSSKSTLEYIGIPKPEKLIEEFKKIYEQEWRSAYHDLEKHYKLSEDTITELLAGIAREAYHFCEVTAKQQFEDITKGHAHVTDVLVQPKYVTPTNKDVLTARSKTIIDKNGYQLTRRFLRDYRRAMAKVPIPGLIDIFESLVQREVLSRHTTLRITPKATRPFIHRLIEITWLMSITEPPMVQVWPRGGQLMSRDLFVPYGKKGATIIHVVWPALLLNKDGTVAERGVCLVK